MSPRAAARLESLGFRLVYDYAAGEADWAAAGLELEGEQVDLETVGHLARRDVPTAGLDELVGKVSARTLGSGWDSTVVVDGRAVVLGRIFEPALRGPGDVAVQKVMEPGPPTFRASFGAREMVDLLQQRRLVSALVTSPEGVLIGMVFREDLERALGRELRQPQRERGRG